MPSPVGPWVGSWPFFRSASQKWQQYFLFCLLCYVLNQDSMGERVSYHPQFTSEETEAQRDDLSQSSNHVTNNWLIQPWLWAPNSRPLCFYQSFLNRLHCAHGPWCRFYHLIAFRLFNSCCSYICRKIFSSLEAGTLFPSLLLNVSAAGTILTC